MEWALLTGLPAETTMVATADTLKKHQDGQLKAMARRRVRKGHQELLLAAQAAARAAAKKQPIDLTAEPAQAGAADQGQGQRMPAGAQPAAGGDTPEEGLGPGGTQPTPAGAQPAAAARGDAPEEGLGAGGTQPTPAGAQPAAGGDGMGRAMATLNRARSNFDWDAIGTGGLNGGGVEDERASLALAWLKDERRSRLEGDHLNAVLSLYLAKQWYSLYPPAPGELQGAPTFPFFWAFQFWKEGKQRRGASATMAGAAQAEAAVQMAALAAEAAAPLVEAVMAAAPPAAP